MNENKFTSLLSATETTNYHAITAMQEDICFLKPI
jgi:hypothetical protein